ncbi:hypothetical protein J2W56_002684 [Nocardia kruczakiae]|uniref:Uncharacterized protein n=1 Tax=Nocardia kruczakiae TaxID=261477 RepID=A0ABU1XEH1_9NOCA|nr:hypothetical protein [Nocardia kruczakiae]
MTATSCGYARCRASVLESDLHCAKISRSRRSARRRTDRAWRASWRTAPPSTLTRRFGLARLFGGRHLGCRAVAQPLDFIFKSLQRSVLEGLGRITCGAELEVHVAAVAVDDSVPRSLAATTPSITLAATHMPNKSVVTFVGSLIGGPASGGTDQSLRRSSTTTRRRSRRPYCERLQGFTPSALGAGDLEPTLRGLDEGRRHAGDSSTAR